MEVLRSTLVQLPPQLLHEATVDEVFQFPHPRTNERLAEPKADRRAVAAHQLLTVDAAETE